MPLPTFVNRLSRFTSALFSVGVRHVLGTQRRPFLTSTPHIARRLQFTKHPKGLQNKEAPNNLIMPLALDRPITTWFKGQSIETDVNIPSIESTRRHIPYIPQNKNKIMQETNDFKTKLFFRQQRYKEVLNGLSINQLFAFKEILEKRFIDPPISLAKDIRETTSNIEFTKYKVHALIALTTNEYNRMSIKQAMSHIRYMDELQLLTVIGVCREIGPSFEIISAIYRPHASSYEGHLNALLLLSTNTIHRMPIERIMRSITKYENLSNRTFLYALCYVEYGNMPGLEDAIFSDRLSYFDLHKEFSMQECLYDFHMIKALTQRKHSFADAVVATLDLPGCYKYRNDYFDHFLQAVELHGKDVDLVDLSRAYHYLLNYGGKGIEDQMWYRSQYPKRIDPLAANNAFNALTTNSHNRMSFQNALNYLDSIEDEDVLNFITYIANTKGALSEDLLQIEVELLKLGKAKSKLEMKASTNSEVNNGNSLTPTV